MGFSSLFFSSSFLAFSGSSLRFSSSAASSSPRCVCIQRHSDIAMSHQILEHTYKRATKKPLNTFDIYIPDCLTAFCYFPYSVVQFALRLSYLSLVQSYLIFCLIPALPQCHRMLCDIYKLIAVSKYPVWMITSF